ncbi:MAG: transcription antitermination factor NusB [Clostridia bacterium]|nr:transcription antitermination factor NusB [Clostridia bacterium]
MTRKEAREQAFVLVFENCFRKETVAELLEIAELYSNYTEDEYCTSIVGIVEENKTQIDEIISKFAKGWKLDRLSKVSLSALRIAIAEIDFMEDIPQSVSINEAVELVKKYATSEDASFVNGILGTYSRSKKED